MTDYKHLIDESISKIKEGFHVHYKVWLANRDPVKEQQLWETYEKEAWHNTLRAKFNLHPVINTLLKYKPKDAYQLALEWPHISEKDPSRLAYTRSVEHGYADRQTVTSIGKYIKRHWPDLADHILRDAQALFCPDKMEIGEGVPYLVKAVELGPRSCMQSGYGSIPFDCDDLVQLKDWLADPTKEEPDWSKHPYSVYLPEYGWKMAIRVSGGRINGRCLLLDDGTHKCFVRSYARAESDEDSSQTDHALEAWLTSKGYVKREEWPEGARLAAIEYCDGYLLPYIDGQGDSSRKVEHAGDHFVRSNSGQYKCDHTDGTYEDEQLGSCEDCGSEVSSDDMCYVEHHDRSVCCSCFDNYIWARSGRRSVLMHRDDVKAAYNSYEDFRARNNADYVDPEDVPDDYVYINNRETYCSIDYAVRCTDGKFYFEDDPKIVELKRPCPASEAYYARRDEAWKDGYGNWYSDWEDSVVVDGVMYLEEACWQCDLTGDWHLDAEEGYNMLNGKVYFAGACERVSSDAEWGDDEINEIRTCDMLDAALERARCELAKEKEEERKQSLLEVFGVTSEPLQKPNSFKYEQEVKLQTLLKAAKALLQQDFIVAPGVSLASNFFCNENYY